MDTSNVVSLVQLLHAREQAEKIKQDQALVQKNRQFFLDLIRTLGTFPTTQVLAMGEAAALDLIVAKVTQIRRATIQAGIEQGLTDEELAGIYSCPVEYVAQCRARLETLKKALSRKLSDSTPLTGTLPE